MEKKSINKNAFTLIELLVVVLIIGILAAIALPQYKLSVERAKAMDGLVILSAFAKAADRVHLEKGSQPLSFDELDIDISYTKKCSLGYDCLQDSSWQYIITSNANRYQLRRIPYNYILERDNGVFYCAAVMSGGRLDFYRRLCKALTGQNAPAKTPTDIEPYAFK